MSDRHFLQLECDLRNSYNRYAEGLDSKDWDKVRSCFAEEIYVDYGPVIDPEGSPDKPRSADQWVAQLQFNIGGFDMTRHTISNHRVISDGQQTVCRAYLVADHVMFPDPAMPIITPDNVATVVGEYTNRYRFEVGEWKIIQSRLEIYWSQGNIDLFSQAITRHAKPTF